MPQELPSADPEDVGMSSEKLADVRGVLADHIDRETGSMDPRPGQVGYLSGQLSSVLDRLRAGQPMTTDDAFADFITTVHTPTVRD